MAETTTNWKLQPKNMAGPSLDGLVNPDMLVWARTQSRLDLAAAAQKIGQQSDRLADWESGAKVPTLNQLRLLANLYKRSVGVFFLREKPRVPKRPVDYRRLELSVGEVMSPGLANGIREAQAKRDAALDIYAQLEEKPPKWNLSLAPNLSAADAANAITTRLQVTQQTRSTWSNQYDALNGWRTAIESLGVIVVQLSRVPMSEMRGCSLALYPMPVIILNGADSPLGRVFTLLHELTHLTREESSLCDLEDDQPRGSANEAVEVYCNRVAAAVLVPTVEFLALPEVRAAGPNSEWAMEQLRILSRRYWVSREAILRCLLDHGKTSQAFYRVMRKRFKQEYQQQRESANDIVVPPHLRIMLSNGRFLTSLAVQAYSAQAITGTELSRVLNAKLDHLPRIRQALAGKAVA